LVVVSAGDVTRLAPTRRAARGHLLIGPVPLVGVIARWDRVVLALQRPLTPNAHMRISTQVTGGTAPSSPPAERPAVEEARARTAPGIWRSAPRDAPDALVLHEDAPNLWIWIELEGDGRTTPELSAVRVEWIGLGLLGALPALYADADEDETAWRLFALLNSSLSEVQEEIDWLPPLFDAAGVSDRADAPWLDALAAWVAMPLERQWDEQLRRRLVGEAFVEHGRRGTRRALEEVLGRTVGATVSVTEPAEGASIWQLGEEGAVLGGATMLTPAEADGAIVGMTADVDRSYLIRDEDFGWPLFADVAHRFCVHVQAVAVDEVRLGALRAAIEREKPAHTLGHLCVLEPRTTVGFQSRIEVDMFVGPPPPTLSLGDELDLRHALRDADQTTVGGRVGETTRVGRRPATAVVGGQR
jgi:phage tail-like protein